MWVSVRTMFLAEGTAKTRHRTMSSGIMSNPVSLKRKSEMGITEDKDTVMRDRAYVGL